MAFRKPKLLNEEALLDYALRALAARGHSISELREKLKRRAERQADVDPVLAKLKQAGYLNDTRFADLYAASRLENEGFGKMRVLRDLRTRRVAPNLAAQAVDRAFRDVDEVALIESFLARKYRNQNLGALLQEEKHLASVYRRLRHAGFSSGASIRVLKRYASQAELLEDSEEREEE